MAGLTFRSPALADGKLILVHGFAMCQEREEQEQQQEEQQHKLQLAKELAQQSIAFGMFLNLQATWAASLALPWGLAAAGAAATRTYVDAGDVKGAVCAVKDNASQQQPLVCAGFLSDSNIPLLLMLRHSAGHCVDGEAWLPGPGT